jgi:hypothetical protein
MVYAWCTDRVPMVYSWCTDIVRMVYRYCTHGVHSHLQANCLRGDCDPQARYKPHPGQGKAKDVCFNSCRGAAGGLAPRFAVWSQAASSCSPRSRWPAPPRPGPLPLPVSAAKLSGVVAGQMSFANRGLSHLEFRLHWGRWLLESGLHFFHWCGGFVF